MARGELWKRVHERTQAALASGALEPIASELVLHPDGGVDFQLRVSPSVEAKLVAAASPGRKDPFEPPYEPDLLVGDVPPAHVALLNKFPVLTDHLLVVTRAFEPQEAWLTPGDCEALLTCLAEGDALAFYNGGRTAGASQGHRHLQLVPLPFGAAARTPMDPLIRAKKLPFRHALSDTPWEAAALHARYRSLLATVLPGPVAPYNLLVTREWMLVVPRTAESFEGVSINALGFVGSLYFKTREALERVRAVGPLEVLRRVSG